MMDGVKNWLLGIVLTSFAAALARDLSPKGREAAAVRLAGGLLMILAILRPLNRIPWDDLALAAGNFAVQSEYQAEEHLRRQQEDFSAVIAERTEAYIWDKASGLDGIHRIAVDVSAGESGIPLPCSVTIAGPYCQELSLWLATELGLDADRQNWLEEGEWNTNNTNESN